MVLVNVVSLSISMEAMSDSFRALRADSDLLLTTL